MARLLIVVLVLLGGATAAQAALLSAGEPLTERFASELLRDALAAGEDDDVTIVIDQPRLPLGNQATVATEVVLADLVRDDGRFRGTLVGTVDGATRFRLPIHGRVQELLKVPALRHPLAAGDRVSDADLTWVSVAPSRLRPGSVTEPDEIVGSEARRRLAPGRPLQQRDLVEPRLVHRGQPVELVYARPGLRVSTLGIAQDDGALGALVRVENADSRRRLQGRVTGPDEVTVGPTGDAAAR